MTDSRTPRLGVDTGGTFTDFAFFDGTHLHSCKVLSTPQAPELAILEGLRQLGIEEAVMRGEIPVIHGTTVATNAALERKGVPVAFITNAGFEDLLTIGRQNRAEIYQLSPDKPQVPVLPEHCLGMSCRVDREGNEIQPIVQKELEELVDQLAMLEVESVAICLLFSWLNDTHEKAIATAIGKKIPHLAVHLSSEIAPRSGEYERAMACWLNASLSPPVAGYLGRLEEKIPAHRLAVMHSAGGTLSASHAANRAVQLLLSGPAGGLAAAAVLGRDIESQGLLTFDMGGTSTDVALIRGQPRLTTEGRIGPWPVIVPMVDMHTIGAGGGSIARIDNAGMLHVGPESAGASPGPACYGTGGNQATVTDAHCYLGHLPQKQLGTSGPEIDLQAATEVLENCTRETDLSTESLAQGIIALAEEHMAGALRKISEQKGQDPAHFELCSFGGAGGLHVCSLAEKLGMHRAVLPVHAGVLSALGMLVAPGLREYTQSLSDEQSQSASELNEAIEELTRQALHELVEEGHDAKMAHRQCWLDCRYAGQSFTLQVPWNGQFRDEDFHQLHDQTYGYRMERPVERVNLRVSIRVAAGTLPAEPAETSKPGQAQFHRAHFSSAGWLDAPVWNRRDLRIGQIIEGPALITEENATALIQPGWTATRSAAGHILLQRN